MPLNRPLNKALNKRWSGASQHTCSARPKEKERVQGFLTVSHWFMAARWAVASSSDWPPARTVSLSNRHRQRQQMGG